MRTLGLEPDPWQVEVLEGRHPRLLLNCCRQAGKSTAVALLGLAEAVFVPFTKVLLVSRSLRQSTELFRIVTDFYRRLGSPLAERQTAEELQLANHSRVVCLPCREETIRGYANVSLLVIDEAARVPDDLYRAVRPMLAVSNGRLIECVVVHLTTPTRTDYVQSGDEETREGERSPTPRVQLTPYSALLLVAEPLNSGVGIEPALQLL
jgi:hypothetical protein